jgi:hypothetical protein
MVAWQGAQAGGDSAAWLQSPHRRGDGATDISGMTRTACHFMLTALIAWTLTAPASAGLPWWPCHCTAGGTTTPCGDTGCGPRYCGEKHEPSRPDPCDCCNRWVGCNGESQPPELLAPWQLPPGRGLQSPADVGYYAEPCGTCGPCGGCGVGRPGATWMRFWPW